MSYALVFPGQGAQEVGMGRDFCDSFEVSRAVFETADRALGFSISDIIFNGPEDELKKTAITQPAIMAMSMCVLEAVRQELGHDVSCAFMAGHSLGEYTALVASGALSLEDGLKLVNMRGDLMQKAVPLGEGAMAAVLGLTEDAITQLCADASSSDGVCEAANFNAPSQTVISGSAAAIERAGSMAKERGAMKFIPLKVSAPFHCKLMRPVADELKNAFDGVSWHDLKFPVVANVDASCVNTSAQARLCLYKQTFSPVQWVESVKYMSGQGVDMFIEIGPGNVLAGLAKRCVKGVRTMSVASVKDMPALIEYLKEAGA